jgi:hypothetical protein
MVKSTRKLGKLQLSGVQIYCTESIHEGEFKGWVSEDGKLCFYAKDVDEVWRWLMDASNACSDDDHDRAMSNALHTVACQILYL